MPQRPYLQHGMQRHRPSGSDPVAPDPWWSLASQGSAAATWDSGTTYAKGDIVGDGGSVDGSYANWVSVQGANVGNDPLSDGDDFTPGSWWICKELLMQDFVWGGDGPSLQLRLLIGPPWETDFSHHIAFKGRTSDVTPDAGILCWLPSGYRPSDRTRVPLVAANGVIGFAEFASSTNTVTLNDPTSSADSGWYLNFIL